MRVSQSGKVYFISKWSIEETESHAVSAYEMMMQLCWYIEPECSYADLIWDDECLRNLDVAVMISRKV